MDVQHADGVGQLVDADRSLGIHRAMRAGRAVLEQIACRGESVLYLLAQCGDT